MYEERDLSHGQQMVECFKPFLRHLVSSGQSRKTLRSHRDNLWILGGEIISKLHEDPRLRKQPTDQMVLAVLDDEGGPLISHGSEDQQRSFDSKVLSLSQRVQHGRPVGSQAMDMWTTQERCPHAHSLNNKYKSQTKVESAKD